MKSTEIENLKLALENQAQANEAAMNLAMQKSEETQEGTIKKEEFDKYKKGIENRLEVLDFALDITKERTENDTENKLNREEFDNYKISIENRLEVLDMAFDIAKQRNEEDIEGTQENLKKELQKIEKTMKELETRLIVRAEPKKEAKILYKDERTGTILTPRTGLKTHKYEDEKQIQEVKIKKKVINEIADLWTQVAVKVKL